MVNENYSTIGKQSLTLAQRLAKAKRATLPFRLTSMTDDDGEPIEARVTRPPLTLLMQQGKIPHAYRDVVSEQIKKFGLKGIQDADSDTTDQMLDDIAKQYGVDMVTMMPDLVDATCIAGFVSPRLVLRQEDEDLERDVMCIDRIPVEDREAYYDWCNKAMEADVDAVKSPDGQQPPPDASGNAPDGEGVRVPADRDLEHVGSVSRSDPPRSEYRGEYPRPLVYRQDAGNQEAREGTRPGVQAGSPAWHGATAAQDDR